MKKYFLFALVMIGLTACNQKADKNQDSTSTETDSTAIQAGGDVSSASDGWQIIDRKDFSIRFPKDWTSKDVQGAEFFINSPQMSADDKYSENISMGIEDLKGADYDLDKYVKAGLKSLKENIVENRRIKLSNQDCQKIVYTQEFPNQFTTKNELYIWVKNGKAYTLAFGYVIEDKNAAQEVGNQIIRTFKLK